MIAQSYTHLSYDLTVDWQFQQTGNSDWYPARVPGCIHLDLLNNKLIEDPFYRDNEAKVQWIENKDWDYRLIFDIPAEIFSKKHVQLIFEGLDTYAMIKLNGHKIITANNMFHAWKADVKSLLNEKGNELRILFRSPIQEILPKLEKIDHKLPAASDPSIGTSPYTRKAPYHYGWDWGPRLVTSGIWQPVKLDAWENMKISDQQFITRQLNENKAHLEVIIDVLSDVDAKASLKISNDKTNFSVVDNIKLNVGLNKITKEIEIGNPELWWPNNFDEQHNRITQLPDYPITRLPKEQPLHKFQTEISAGKDLVTATKRIGLRTIEIKREPDQWGESFTIVVNGIPVFAKGANWIPADSFTPRVSAEKYRYLLTSAVDVNMNMIRVWGGGIYESDVFYDLCDELGILIWQDFMFSCALYPGDDEFLNSVKEEAIYQVRRLRHHPCIALWCGNNEIEMGWRDWKWQENALASMWDDYLKLFHGVLPEICKAEDPTRIYWLSSPASDTASVVHPNHASYGDTHSWGVWHGQEPFECYKKHFPRFISEYGFQSFPDPESVDKFTTKDDHDIFSPVMLTHQKNKRGNELIKDYLEKYYIIPQQFDHFLLLSQVLQAEGIKVGAEHFRRIRPRCMGSLYWQLNDCWPVASWSSIDYYGSWKALHYYARRFYAPVLISPNYEYGKYQFYAISDKVETIEAQLQIKLLDFEGRIFSEWLKQIQIRPQESKVYFSLEKREIPGEIDPRKSFLYCSLQNADGIIFENTIHFVPPKKSRLCSPDICVAIDQDDAGFMLTLSAKNLARSVILFADGIEGNFGDNFFDLYPGQTRNVRFLIHKKIEETKFKQAFRFITLFDLMENK